MRLRVFVVRNSESRTVSPLSETGFLIFETHPLSVPMRHVVVFFYYTSCWQT